MSDQLRLILLGTPEFFLNDQPLTDFNSNKTRALLIYLALNGRSLMRTTLAGLFWGDMPEDKAHTNLRKSIANLNKMVGDWLEVTRQTAVFNPQNCWIDVLAFEEAGMAETAVSLYNGDFLDGFYVDDAPEFEQWLLALRARLREQMLGALYSGIQTQTQQHNQTQAITYCQRLLAMETWREEIHQQLMQLYVRNGQRSNALAQYAQCKQLLWDELGVLPSSATEKLAERIRNRPSPPHNLNRPATPFIGRAEEIAALQNELLDPNGRLLTILGHGGIGKTRLAQAVGETLTDHFLEGVWFVELADVDRPELVPHAIGTALGLHFAAATPADEQLIDHLRQRELLLILDNMEHLVEVADFLAQLLHAAPDLTLLLTSRREMQLQEEQIWHISGLPFPDDDAPADPSSYPALTLFEAVARRRQRTFRLNGDTPAVSQICRLVEGSPLAIELAAAATHRATPAAIASQLQANFDSLQSQWRNTPARHRSLRAVFDHSWALLPPAGQEAFRQLAVFHGPFSAEAAAQITQMARAELNNLVANSLLRPIDDSQFSPHELLRQFALERLQAEGEKFAELNGRHASYYLDFIAQHGSHISTAGSLAAQQQIVASFSNIVAAWRWHTSHRADEVPLAALRGWLDYFLL
ncbi:MAG: AAA family ATPase, partial [Anaerolineales bacterium]|nr:AAA family ATPase [Anaerolineales bacterium]